jgi:hypothetical protein
MALATSEGRPEYLTNLPTELLMEIFPRSLDDDATELPTLAALALVCHRFQAIVTPILYTTLWSCCHHRDRLLERAISLRPALTGYVKRFVGETGHYSNRVKRFGSELVHYKARNNQHARNRHDEEPRYESWSYREALARAAKLQIPEEKLRALLPKAYSPNMPPHRLRTLFIVLQCPNIEELDSSMDDEFMFFLPLTWAAEKGPVGLVHQFKNLRTLSLPIHSGHKYQISTLRVAFQLASLRTLKLQTITKRDEKVLWEIDRISWSLARPSSPIQELVLEQCYLDCRWVSQAIATCAALRRFCWTFQGRFFESLGGENLYPAVLGALLEHSKSLEDVKINETDVCAYTDRAPPTIRISWKDCKRLAYLDIPMFTLVASSRRMAVQGHEGDREVLKLDPVLIQNVLPASLKVLAIDLRTHVNGASDLFFINIVDAVSCGYFHALERVEVITTHGCRNVGISLPLHFCHLRRMFSSQNVEFFYSLELAVCEAHPSKFAYYPSRPSASLY